MHNYTKLIIIVLSVDALKQLHSEDAQKFRIQAEYVEELVRDPGTA